MNLYNDHFQENEMNTQEIWKDIPGFEEHYQASSYGRIRSKQRKITQKGHKNFYTRTMNGKILQPREQNSNYHLVWLSVGSKKFPELVHRLVAKTFILNADNKSCVNHKNGKKTDNRIKNLEWCSYSENIKHAHKIIERKKVSKHILCVELNQVFQSIIGAAQILEINRCAISHALNGRSKTAGGFTWMFV
jgi:hypothetical protein